MPDEGSSVELGRYAEPAVLVLASLSEGAKHGYAIMADVEAFSGLRMGPGTLYAVLARLEQAGLVAPLPRRRPSSAVPAHGRRHRRPGRAPGGDGALRARRARPPAAAGSRPRMSRLAVPASPAGRLLPQALARALCRRAAARCWPTADRAGATCRTWLAGSLDAWLQPRAVAGGDRIAPGGRVPSPGRATSAADHRGRRAGCAADRRRRHHAAAPVR